MNPEPQPLLNRKECAKHLGINPSTLDKYVETGLIPVVEIGDRIVRFDAAEVVKALTRIPGSIDLSD